MILTKVENEIVLYAVAAMLEKINKGAAGLPMTAELLERAGLDVPASFLVEVSQKEVYDIIDKLKAPPPKSAEDVWNEFYPASESAGALYYTGKLKRMVMRAVDVGEARYRSAVEELVTTVNDTGGVRLNKNGVFYPLADEDWTDLAYAYQKACEALGCPIKDKPDKYDPDSNHEETIDNE